MSHEEDSSFQSRELLSNLHDLFESFMSHQQKQLLSLLPMTKVDGLLSRARAAHEDFDSFYWDLIIIHVVT